MDGLKNDIQAYCTATALGKLPTAKIIMRVWHNIFCRVLKVGWLDVSWFHRNVWENEWKFSDHVIEIVDTRKNPTEVFYERAAAVVGIIAVFNRLYIWPRHQRKHFLLLLVWYNIGTTHIIYILVYIIIMHIYCISTSAIIITSISHHSWSFKLRLKKKIKQKPRLVQYLIFIFRYQFWCKCIRQLHNLNPLSRWTRSIYDANERDRPSANVFSKKIMFLCRPRV